MIIYELALHTHFIAPEGEGGFLLDHKTFLEKLSKLLGQSRVRPSDMLVADCL